MAPWAIFCFKERDGASARRKLVYQLGEQKKERIGMWTYKPICSSQKDVSNEQSHKIPNSKDNL